MAENKTENVEKRTEKSSKSARNTAKNEEVQANKPVSELRINIGTRIDDTQGMGIHFKSDEKIVPWGVGVTFKNQDTEKKPKRKYNRKPKNDEESQD